jgi:hypothetical protein
VRSSSEAQVGFMFGRRLFSQINVTERAVEDGLGAWTAAL